MIWNTLKTKLNSGNIIRYHTCPHIGNGQNVAEHTWKAMAIMVSLYEPIDYGKALLYLLFHDVAEIEFGDLPATTKWDYPRLAKNLNTLERTFEEKLGLPVYYDDLTEKEHRISKICDLLELIIHSKKQINIGNCYAKATYNKGISKIKELYSTYPEYTPVKKLLEEIQNEQT